MFNATNKLKLITIIIILPLLINTGCSYNKHMESKEGDLDSVVVTSNSEHEENLHVINSTYENINEKVQKQEDIYGITWLSEESIVAFVKGNPDEWYGQMYIWQVGETEPTLIDDKEYRICELIPSPDHQYFLADIGTSIQRIGSIVSIEDKVTIDTFGCIGTGFWSPDSEWLIFGQLSDIKPKIDIELDGTVDLVKYNIKTKEIIVLEEGTSDYYFTLIKQVEDGTIIYAKAYYESDELDEEGKIHF
ncbi:hypothetical protein [Alkaliphilus peptidifermentans]|uniref:Uncharacterized protein n=1 Tax=Alkaliphilus peptidifermentans DSM 18978 TaxID=1120976 RepID=A0A1G5FER2_9FIRM|nr:hypothetical protein [Alkaliphilus peptidifermentans]SCY37693.1 hypothetical protein SAMN03080606_01393 [Alkaliphilus peptidifermentans DSM 18978]